LIGSVCSGEHPGYFLVADLEDLETGTAHLVSRARRIHMRVAKLRRLARERFSEAEVLQLFELEPASSSGSSSIPGSPPETSAVPPTSGDSSSEPMLGHHRAEGSHNRASRGGPEPVEVVGSLPIEPSARANGRPPSNGIGTREVSAARSLLAAPRSGRGA
jgi:hypothetical protein